MASSTYHAALSVGPPNLHLTVFYNDRCDAATLFQLAEHLQRLPTGRVVVPLHRVELTNPDDADDPMVALKVEILDADGERADEALMRRIADFSDAHSWRSGLDAQYKFFFHVTLGKRSEVMARDAPDLQLRTGVPYIKDHQLGRKLFIR
jgi:2'-5' RNA ligase